MTAECVCLVEWSVLSPQVHRDSGEGNGNPLRYSCLENPRDRGAWRAAVYGVTQSRTRLKRLSSRHIDPPCLFPPPSLPLMSGSYRSLQSTFALSLKMLSG